MVRIGTPACSIQRCHAAGMRWAQGQAQFRGRGFLVAALLQNDQFSGTTAAFRQRHCHRLALGENRSSVQVPLRHNCAHRRPHVGALLDLSTHEGDTVPYHSNAFEDMSGMSVVDSQGSLGTLGSQLLPARNEMETNVIVTKNSTKDVSRNVLGAVRGFRPNTLH